MARIDHVWEYSVMTFDGSAATVGTQSYRKIDPTAFAGWLNGLGVDGWELINWETTPGGRVLCVLKRMKHSELRYDPAEEST